MTLSAPLTTLPEQRWLRTTVGMLLALSLGTGCSTLSLSERPALPLFVVAAPLPTAGLQANLLPPIESCLAWYAKIDTAIDAASVRDASAHRLKDFPHLRLDRFAASFRDQARHSPKIMATLLWYARDLDLATREKELANLPIAWRGALMLNDLWAVHDALERCSQTLVRHDLATPSRLETLLNQWQVPDHYALWKRALGLYPLTSIPFFQGVSAWQRSTEKNFSDPLIYNAHQPDLIRYAPATQDAAAVELGPQFAASLRNTLGIPQLSEVDWTALLNRYAPIFDIETKGEFDRIGQLQFNPQGQLAINASTPVSYQRIGFTRISGSTHVQLIYSVWFSARPSQKHLDLLAGSLDGVTIRITLDHNGAPLLVDSIHACGCYHLFFPTPRLLPRPQPSSQIEWAFIPKTLPVLAFGQRVVVRLASGTHYLTDIRPLETNTIDTAQIRYQLRQDHELQSMPFNDIQQPQERKSAFSPDGLIVGSERGERFLFWPMGISSPGAMRQWGTHATAFVGIRHFDDADLIDKRFSVIHQPAAQSAPEK